VQLVVSASGRERERERQPPYMQVDGGERGVVRQCSRECRSDSIAGAGAAEIERLERPVVSLECLKDCGACVTERTSL